MKLFQKFYFPDETGYGYAEDTGNTANPFLFGGNFGVTTLKKFEWIPNAGKGGTELEALDIVFNINGTDKSYRLFPVSKVYVKTTGGGSVELTDKDSQEYKAAYVAAVKDQSALIVHILHAFQSDDVVKAGLSKPFRSFKEWSQAAASLLPNNFQDIKLDIFMQYQWQISDGQNKTYLELPKKMSYGAWLKKTIAPVGSWKEVRKDNIQDNTQDALTYVDDAGNVHPFKKNGWFMKSNFAVQQRNDATASTNASAAMNSGASVAPAPTNTPSQAASGW